MILIGAILLVVAALCIVFGLAFQTIQFLIWVGIGLIVVGAIVLVANRFNTRNLP